MSRFCAPEVITASEPALAVPSTLSPQYGKAVDLYFEIMIWELTCGKEAYATSDRDQTRSKRHTRALWGKVMEGERPEIDAVAKFGNDICELLKKCWDANSSKRPTFKGILVGTT